jgi:hypothetical protein
MNVACNIWQVVDELSDDETPRRLGELGIRVLQPPQRLGVTHNWNMVRPAARHSLIRCRALRWNTASGPLSEMLRDTSNTPRRHIQLQVLIT